MFALYCVDLKQRRHSRLNYQHSLWKQGIGFLVHPEIPVGDIHDLRIADIGSGTWCVFFRSERRE